MKTYRIVYYISTGLLTLFMLFSVSMYFFNYESVKGMFENFGYPTYIIYPYASTKLLGVFAIWNPNFRILREWAYAGFFFAFILAFFAHFMIEDGQHMGALIALALLLTSYYFSKKII